MGLRRRARWLSAVVVMIVLASLLLACQGPAGPTGPAGPQGVAGTSGAVEVPDSLLGSGVFPDTATNSDFLHTGGRGCNSCHASLADVLIKLDAASPLKHMAQAPGYGKPLTVGYCTPCHIGLAFGVGPKLAATIHPIHYFSSTFVNDDNGNCMSCHAIDTEGNWVLWEEVMYEPGVYGWPDPNATTAWNMKRGFPTGYQTAFTMDSVVKGNISLTQDVTTAAKDLFLLWNYGLPNPELVSAANYKLTITGLVDNQKTYTLPELQNKVQRDAYLTIDCVMQPNAGSWIANVKWTGVSLKTLLDEAGVKPEANALLVTAYDGWQIYYTLERAQNPDFLAALKMNDAVLTNETGYPVTLTPPGSAGADFVKWVKTIEVINYEGDPPRWLPLVLPNSGFLKPTVDGTVVSAGAPVRLEGWAYGCGVPIVSIQFSGDYGNNWKVVSVPQPTNVYTWIYWTYDWESPGPGTYLLKLRVEDGNGKLQDNPANLVITVK